MKGILADALKAALPSLEDPAALRRALSALHDKADQVAGVFQELQLVDVLRDLIDEPEDPVVRERWRLTGQQLLVALSPLLLRVLWHAVKKKP